MLSKFFFSSYRKEPISAFILIIGVVDGIMGGFSQRWTLVSFGVFFMILSIIVRTLQIKKNSPSVTTQASRRYLPPSQSSMPLPSLTKNQR